MRVNCIKFSRAFEDYSKPKARKRKLRQEAVAEYRERQKLRLFGLTIMHQ